MRTTNPFLIFLLSLALVACSTGRTYHAFDSLWSLGYNDTRTAEDRWSVSYRGYEISGTEANDYALLRAAEVASEAGYRYFVITSEQNSTSSRTLGTVNSYGGQINGVVAGSSYPEVRLSITAYKLKPNGNGNVYDCKYLAAAIRKKYDL